MAETVSRSAGLNIPSGCTFGLCGTCKIRKVAGEVHMVHNGGISDDDIAGVNIPTGIPLLYELDDDFKPVTKGGRYLDPEAAAAGAKAVANQGNK